MAFINHTSRSHSEKCRYADRKTNRYISHNTLHVIWLSHFKRIQLNALMVFSINGWVELETTHPLSTLDNTWTCAWFGTHIYWHANRLLIFWNKETILKLFLNKTHWNINFFDSSCNYFSLNHINALCLSSQLIFDASVWGANAFM